MIKTKQACMYIWYAQQPKSKSLELNLSLAIELINLQARRIKLGTAVELYDNVPLKKIQNIRPSTNSCVAVQDQNTWLNVRAQIGARHRPVCDQVDSEIHPQGPPSPD